MADKKINGNNDDIYEYIRVVDDKVTQNEKTLKFITAQQSEQMKELIGSKTENLRRFFEEAIRMQTEIVRNAYEEIITELKNTYENDLKNREVENIKLLNQKEEMLKSVYDAQVKALKESFESDCQKRINECYIKTKSESEEEKIELITKYKQEIQATADKVYQDAKKEFSSELQATADKVYFDSKAEFEKTLESEKQAVYDAAKAEFEAKLQATAEEYEDRIEEIKAWNAKNLQTKIAETEDFFKKAEQQIADEAYANGKADTEAWHDDVVRQKLEIQAQYFQEELQNQEQRLKSEISQTVSDEVYQNTKKEYEDRIAEINAWHAKNLAEKLEEMKNYYEGKIQQNWSEHEDIVRQKLEVQAQYFQEEIEHAKEETKAEMMSQMDEAARRNEEELKLFLDFYEAKIKPFKKLINIHETTDKRIKDIQQRLQNRFNKTFGNK